MLLLGNIFITSPNGHYQRGYLPANGDNFDILKYALASYAVIPQIKKVKLQIALDAPWRHRWDELAAWVNDLFGTKAELVDGRCVHQPHWKALADQLLQNEEDLIWLACNHDHVFYDYNIDAVTRVMNRLEEDKTLERSCYYSHYTEFIRTMQAMPEYEVLDDGVIRTMWRTRDSPQIVSKHLFHRWWNEVSLPDHMYMPRTDWGGIWECPPYRCYLPHRQICRHFDGYSHLFGIDRMPPISIPPGFFDRDIKIRFGYDTPREGWVHINPKIPVYRTSHPDGVDYKWALEDIPLFWRGRISDVSIAPGTTEEDIYPARNEALRDYMCAPGSTNHDVGRFLPREESLARMMR